MNRKWINDEKLITSSDDIKKKKNKEENNLNLKTIFND